MKYSLLVLILESDTKDGEFAQSVVVNAICLVQLVSCTWDPLCRMATNILLKIMVDCEGPLYRIDDVQRERAFNMALANMALTTADR